MLTYELARAIQADRDRETAAKLRRNALRQEVTKDVDYDVEIPRRAPSGTSRTSLPGRVGSTVNS